MRDTFLDDLKAVFSDLGATLKEVDTHLSNAYHAFLDRLGHRLYRFGYRLQGEEYNSPDDSD